MFSNRRSREIDFHLTIILLVTWVTFAYRDLWPLATYNLTPLDIQEGWLMWFKVVVLSLAAIIIPLLVPRKYTPFDPKVSTHTNLRSHYKPVFQHPMPVTNPEQTASILSMGLYFFLDSIVSKAWRMEHLGLDDIPPLPDDDEMKNLVQSHFKVWHWLFGFHFEFGIHACFI